MEKSTLRQRAVIYEKTALMLNGIFGIIFEHFKEYALINILEVTH